MLSHLFLFFIFLQIYDLVISYYGIAGGLTEYNPFAVFVYSHGFLMAGLYKIVGVLTVFKFCSFVQYVNKYYALYVLLLLNLAYLLICLNNTYLYLRWVL